MAEVAEFIRDAEKRAGRTMSPALSCLPEWMQHEHSTGTSIMAVEFDGGVVLGADSRTTTGQYIANRVSDKLSRVTDYIYCCRSGSAADTQAVSDVVKYHLEFHEIELGKPAKVSTATSIFRDICYNNRDNLSAGIIVAGWDKVLGGQVYCVPIGGMSIRQSVAIGGSGSTYVYGYVDSAYRTGMTSQECQQFVLNTLTLAMNRDGSSGGVVRLAIITEKGVERKVVTGSDLPKFYSG